MRRPYVRDGCLIGLACTARSVDETQNRFVAPDTFSSVQAADENNLHTSAYDGVIAGLILVRQHAKEMSLFPSV